MTVTADFKLVEAKLGFPLHDFQTAALEAIVGGENVIVHSPTGCHTRGQGILMYDGSVKRVEDVKFGDMLMGPDSKPRTVRQLIRGRDSMFEITPVKGTPFIVNEDHVLTLVRTGVIRRPQAGSRKKVDLGGTTVDVRLGDWLTWSKTQKHLYKLFRTRVMFPTSCRYLPIDPYFLGVLLGDGAIRGTPSVSKNDVEIEQVCRMQAKVFGLKVRVDVNDNGDKTYCLPSLSKPNGRRGGSNALTNNLRALGLFDTLSETKFVPHRYKIAARKDRLALLAGLLDTDGSLSRCGYDFISKSERLAADTVFLARSLGFAAYVNPCKKADQNGTVGDYFRVSMSGETSLIPCRIPRKQAPARRQKKSVLRTGFQVRPVGRDSFFGFTLDGDGRYLLDDFTVTHNSGKSEIFQGASLLLENLVVVIYPLRALVKDQARRCAEVGLSYAEFYGDTKSKDRHDILLRIQQNKAKLILTTPESFKYNKHFQRVLQDRGISLLVVDEAHTYEEWAFSFRPAYRDAGPIARRLGVKQVMLCSATITIDGAIEAAKTFQLARWSLVQIPTIRENLVHANLYGFEKKALWDIAAERTAMYQPPGIAFFSTVAALDRWRLEAQSKSTTEDKLPLLYYHGQLGDKARRLNQEAWMKDDRWIMATKAFGMGIDKANVRTTIHFMLPSSVLDFAQETGRAGRDGATSRCFLTQYDNGSVHEFLINKSLPSVKLVEKLHEWLRRQPVSPKGFTIYDKDVAASHVDADPETISVAFSWLKTAKIIRGISLRQEFIFFLDKDSEQAARAYGHGAVEIVDWINDFGVPRRGGLSIKPSALEKELGSQFSDWKGKLKRLAENEIFSFKPPVLRSPKVKFIKNTFDFEAAAERLTAARERAFMRLDQMREVQRTPPNRRAVTIDRMIALDVDALKAKLAKLRKKFEG